MKVINKMITDNDDYITALRAIRDVLFMFDAQYSEYDAAQKCVVESALNSLYTAQSAPVGTWQFNQRLLFALSLRISDICAYAIEVHYQLRALLTVHNYVRTAFADNASFEATLATVYWQLDNALQALEQTTTKQ